MAVKTPRGHVYLDDGEVMRMRAMLAKGSVSREAIAAKFDVSLATVVNVEKRRGRFADAPKPKPRRKR